QTLIDSTLILGLILVLSVLFLPRGVVPTLGILFSRWSMGRRRRPERGSARRRMRDAANV
ncbi:MAG: hypothetical protein KDJ63_16130, partial [Nitratireductor sp.]|nr:hypothetical protein [Nitratireductor sp.]